MENIKHPLHLEIGRKLKEYDRRCNVILDPVCGGNQNIPIFLEEKKAFETEICNVDVLFIKNNKIIIIIEIEESNIKPTQICGKFLTSSLGKFFIHRNFEDQKICYDNNVLFLHILDKSKLKQDKSKKIDQGLKIKEKIVNLIKNDSWKSNVKEYDLFYTEEGDEDTQRELIELIEKKINRV